MCKYVFCLWQIRKYYIFISLCLVLVSNFCLHTYLITFYKGKTNILDYRLFSTFPNDLHQRTKMSFHREKERGGGGTLGTLATLGTKGMVFWEIWPNDNIHGLKWQCHQKRKYKNNFQLARLHQLAILLSQERIIIISIFKLFILKKLNTFQMPEKAFFAFKYNMEWIKQFCRKSFK